jgi:hypothetical protein
VCGARCADHEKVQNASAVLLHARSARCVRGGVRRRCAGALVRAAARMDGPLGLLRQASSSKARLDALEAWKVRARGAVMWRSGRADWRARIGGVRRAASRSLTPRAFEMPQALPEETKASRDQAAEACDLADTLLRDANWKARRGDFAAA